MIKIKGREYLSTSEAAAFIGINIETLRSYFRTGRVFRTLRKERDTRWYIFKGEAQRFKDGKISVSGAYEKVVKDAQ